MAETMTMKNSPPGPLGKNEQDRGDVEEAGSSRDGSMSPMNTGTEQRSSGTAREPEDQNTHTPDREMAHYKAPSSYPGPMDMDTDSPSSYPKHVIVPSDAGRPHKTMKKSYNSHPSQFSMNSQQESPPVLSRETPPRSSNMYGHSDSRPSSMPSPYPPQNRNPPYYPNQEMEGTSPSYHGHGHAPPSSYHGHGHGEHGGILKNVQVQPRRWACDYCCVATFPTYEEACAHEEVCSRTNNPSQGGEPPKAQPLQPNKPHYNQGSHYDSHPGAPPPPQYGHGPPPPRGGSSGGLGALYQATQEVQPPPHPQQHHDMWAHHHPPSSSYSPHSSRYQHGTPLGSRDNREHNPHSKYQHYDESQRTMLLATPADGDSLSDRQCYVRSDFVEVFEATERDVQARHSKGAQKLAVGQIGIRCVHCARLRPKDRAERAVCYPSSISRIYQTVADMQRFHFEQCREIPQRVRSYYKALKTTRPRGVGSPQAYWIESAKKLGLVDSEIGIRFGTEEEKTL